MYGLSLPQRNHRASSQSAVALPPPPPGAALTVGVLFMPLLSLCTRRQSPGVTVVDRKMQQLAPPGAVNTSRCGKATNPASAVTSDTRAGRRRFSDPRSLSSAAAAIAAATQKQWHSGLYTAQGSPGAKSPATKHQPQILALASAASYQQPRGRCERGARAGPPPRESQHVGRHHSHDVAAMPAPSGIDAHRA